MPVAQGLVSILCDPSQHTVISDAWVADVASYGVSHVRCALVTAPDGSLPTALIEQGTARYAARGIGVIGAVTADFRPVADVPEHFSNMALNTTGNTLLSPYIDAASMRLATFARHAQDHGLTGLYLPNNEPNEFALLAEGVNPPAGEKGGSLAPAVYAAMSWQCATRVKGLAPRLQHRICGSLSAIAGTGHDTANPYLARYLDEAYKSLVHKLGGIPRSYPWTATGLNMEGWFAGDEAALLVAAVQKVKAKYKDYSPVWLGEWGVKNSWLRGSEARMVTTYKALIASGADAMSLYAHHGATPYLGDPLLYPAWGCVQWREQEGTFWKVGEYRQAAAARACFAS